MELDLVKLLSALAGTGLVSVAVARSLAGKLLDHQLEKDLKLYDEKIDQRLAEHQYKQMLDGFRREVGPSP